MIAGLVDELLLAMLLLLHFILIDDDDDVCVYYTSVLGAVTWELFMLPSAASGVTTVQFIVSISHALILVTSPRFIPRHGLAAASAAACDRSYDPHTSPCPEVPATLPIGPIGGADCLALPLEGSRAPTCAAVGANKAPFKLLPILRHTLPEFLGAVFFSNTTKQVRTVLSSSLLTLVSP